MGEESLRNLDEDGIIYEVPRSSPATSCRRKITPKGETELTAEEHLLRAIFGEKAREVRDSSLRLPHGERIVVDVGSSAATAATSCSPASTASCRSAWPRSARSASATRWPDSTATRA